MARRRYEPMTKKNSTFGLNITSMTDMFTILLVFLLQTFSTADVQINPAKDVRLPSSKSEANPVEAIKLSLSNSELKLEEKTVAQLNSAKFKDSDLEAHDPNFIEPLFRQLDQLAKNATKGPAKEGKILLQADKDLPYATIRKVMYTASMAGFPQLKLVTVAGN